MLPLHELESFRPKFDPKEQMFRHNSSTLKMNLGELSMSCIACANKKDTASSHYLVMIKRARVPRIKVHILHSD